MTKVGKPNKSGIDWNNPKEVKAHRRDYNNRSEIKNRLKVWGKNYHKKPEVKDRLKEWRNTKEQKDKTRAYSERSEVKERRKKYAKEYRRRNIVKSAKYHQEYMKRPGVKERLKKYAKEYHQEYMKRPGVKERLKKRNQLPEVIIKKKERDRKRLAEKHSRTVKEYNNIIKECIICRFDKVVDLHHIDGKMHKLNKEKNNNINNQIGLCPNHHMMIHRNYKIDILRKILINIKTNLIQTALVRHQLNTAIAVGGKYGD